MNKSKIYMIISICILCISVIGSTIAYYREEFNTNLNTITYGLDYYINYAKGQDITSATLLPASSYTEGNSSDIELWKKDNTYNIYGHIYLDINQLGTSLSKSSALKYTLVSNDTPIAEGTVKGSAGKSILIKSDIPLQTTKQLYTIYIWLDKNAALDTSIQSETISLTARCEASMKPTDPRISTIINNLYELAPKTIVKNNTIEYNYATSVNLMNDRLGGTTTDYNAGNIRYYGANPNNYVYFNCSDYNNQTSSTCETWRILGLFDGKIKLVRTSSIGTFSWDNKNTSTGAETNSGSNDWTDARLMKLLNPGHETETIGGSLYYNSGSGKCYAGQNNASKTCDFKSTGIKNVETRNMIEDTKWNLGGITAGNSPQVYSNDFYKAERGTDVYEGRPTTWTGKVAVPYVSDYGYAVDFTSCSNPLGNYGNTSCSSVNWMYKNYGTGWFLTLRGKGNITTASPHHIWHARSNVPYRTYSAYNSYDVIPVLYIYSDAEILAGDGTSTSPYQLAVYNK